MAFSFRSPQTTQEKRKSQENQELIRPSRNIRNLPDAWDEIPTNGKHREHKHFKRWLKKQIGRVWDDVYSDIIKKFGDDGREYVRWKVYTSVIMIDGKPCTESGTRIGWLNSYYIHPETNVLSKDVYEKRKDSPKEITSIKTENPNIEYTKINGIWYLCEYRMMRLFSHLKPIRTIIKKRQLDKKSLRKLNLKNDVV